MIIHDRQDVNSARNDKPVSEISKSCEQLICLSRPMRKSRHRTLSLSRLAWQTERVFREGAAVLLQSDALAGDNFRKD